MAACWNWASTVGQVQTSKSWAGIFYMCGLPKLWNEHAQKDNYTQMNHLFTRKSLLEHMSLYCYFWDHCQFVSPPSGKACVNICITSRSKSKASSCVFLLSLFSFFFCPPFLLVNIWAKRAGGQVVGSQTALQVSGPWQMQLHRWAAQQVLIWVCLPHHSFILWDHNCQLGPKQPQIRGELVAVVL